MQTQGHMIRETACWNGCSTPLRDRHIFWREYLTFKSCTYPTWLQALLQAWLQYSAPDARNLS